MYTFFFFSGDKTKNYVGVGETLLISAVNGLIFAIFAAQPLLIVGATGPLMIFDMSLYSVSFLYFHFIELFLKMQPATVTNKIWNSIYTVLYSDFLIHPFQKFLYRIANDTAFFTLMTYIPYICYK